MFVRNFYFEFNLLFKYNINSIVSSVIMQTQQRQSQIDNMFYNPTNFEMLVSLLSETLQSRHSIKLTESTYSCVKNELLSIMQQVFDNRHELPTPPSLSEYNLMLNKRVLDLSLKTIPAIVNKNLPCRPDASTRFQDSIDSAFEKLQSERNARIKRPSNPFTNSNDNASNTSLNQQSSHFNESENNKLSSFATQHNDNVRYESRNTQEQRQAQISSSLNTFNDTSDIMDLLHSSVSEEHMSDFSNNNSNSNVNANSSTSSLSLADTIQQFHEETEKIDESNESFAKELEARLKKREEDFRQSTQLSPEQERVLQEQIKNDAEETVQNVYPMDESTDKLLPQSLQLDNSFARLDESTLEKEQQEINKNKKIERIPQTTTIQLSSADRDGGKSRYDYTIDTSLFNTSIKHIESIEIMNIVMPAYEMNTVDAHSVGQYLLLDIPELNTHNIGSNNHLTNSQCMLFVDKLHSSSTTARGSLSLRNENKTRNVYAKNIMRQLPRQLTVRVLDMNGEIYGNELTMDNLNVANVVVDASGIHVRCVQPFVNGAQLRIGDKVVFADVSSDDDELNTFLARKKGHTVSNISAPLSLDATLSSNPNVTTDWSISFDIANHNSGSIIPQFINKTVVVTNLSVNNTIATMTVPPNTYTADTIVEQNGNTGKIIATTTGTTIEVEITNGTFTTGEVSLGTNQLTSSSVILQERPETTVSATIMNLSAQNTITLLIKSRKPSV